MANQTALTITEALSNKKLLAGRIDTKRQFIERYLTRPSTVKDPLEKDGGSQGAIQRALQSVRDLEDNLISTMEAIHAANAATVVEIDGIRRTVANWIVWKDAVAPKYLTFLQSLVNSVSRTRDPNYLTTLRRQLQSTADATEDLKLEVNIDEAWLSKELERVQSLLQKVDGRLSLVNATTQVTVPEIPEI